ncbi:hypothetical protein CY0110_16642 [Crocosphaera chwakensis CCY0110]|uniref:Uncharacterized protein n=1 Tax=Crocosphaera chwakensis CCY0110 TaxID=391612 RepID=A3II10_9CHRO|nr:hypothetical protein CY0110_16642 [Crocosphaera chwakensis CCY0110]
MASLNSSLSSSGGMFNQPSKTSRVIIQPPF